jgi:geranylgeranyl pyrophosphate synthase
MPGGPIVTDSTAQAERAVRELFTEIERTIELLIADYTEQYGNLRAAVPAAVKGARRDRNEFSLPLLVHAAETGDPSPAVPIAAVHALWWRAANVIDDIADGHAGDPEGTLSGGATMMAAFNWAYVLPTYALEHLPIPERLRHRLTAEFFQACTAATDGQIGDMHDDPGNITPERVLATYRNKSSSPYVMASSMAAAIAGADDRRTELWRRFGMNLGLLGQFRNDQDDLDTGRLEDLKNRTPTYHLVELINSGSGPGKERIVALLGQARDNADARRTLLDHMLAPDVVRSYLHQINRIRDDSNRILDSLDGVPSFTEALRTRMNHAASPCDLLMRVLEPTRVPG